jgi:hypothetical protein
MFEVWQNLAPFGNRPISGAVEALHHPSSLIGRATSLVCMSLKLILLFLLIAITANRYLVPAGAENSFHSPQLPTTNTMAMMETFAPPAAWF